MNNNCKVSPKYIFSGIIVLLFSIVTYKTTAHGHSYVGFRNILTFSGIDTIPVKVQDSLKLPASDSTKLVPDTSPRQKIDTFSVKFSKDSLEAPLKYAATDSIVFDVKNSKVYMYGKASTEYKTTSLTADRIFLDQPNQMIMAMPSTDTSGLPIGTPKMMEGETPMRADTILYNIKTQRGLTKSTFTQQGEMYVAGEVIKKVNATDYFASRATVTTCNYDHPHFAFRAGKMKLVNKKLAVTGPIHPEFEDVPIPIYLPFGLFPMSNGGRHSGLLAPTFSTNEQFGLGLEGLGYYKVFNDNLDATLLTNIYSYGGWSFSVQPTYHKRYRYSGSLNFRMQNTKINFKGDPDYFKSKTFNVAWSHTVDSKARPGQTFSANVNAGSTKFNQYTPNNAMQNFQNNMNSSISYSKNWDGKMNLTVNANHSQNSNTRLVNMSLPDIGFSATTIYPFQREEMAGQPKWYEKLGVGLNSSFRSQIAFYDSAFSFGQLIDTFQWGASHSIPITLPLPPLGPLQISPSISFDERWYAQEFIRQWNPNEQKVDTFINKGFYAARQMSFGLGFNTAIFGTKTFKNSRLMAIRHVVRPSFSLNYRPDFQKSNYDSVRVSPDRVEYHSRFEGSIAGAFGQGTFGGIGFGIDNNLEMKLRSKKDTSEDGVKKIRLIDGFGFNGSYNMMADSFKLSQISLYMRSTLFEKVNITGSATLDPYQVDSKGFQIDKYAWETGKGFSLASLGRITGGSLALSTQFASKRKDDGKEAEAKKKLEDDLGPITMEEQQMLLDDARRNPAEYTDFNVPWSVNLSLSLNFQNVRKPDYSGFQTVVNSSLNAGGDFNLTPKWKVGASGYYDIKETKLQSFTMFISREMHCWQMSINITPVGLYRYFNITINPKSGLLRDLKVNRTRYFYTNPGF